MRRNGADRLPVVEIVAELRPGLLLTSRHLGDELAVGLQMLAQLAEELGIFGELLHQDLACTVQRRLGIRHSGVVTILGRERRLEVFRRLFFRVETGVGQQCRGEPFEPSLAGNHRLGAARGRGGRGGGGGARRRGGGGGGRRRRAGGRARGRGARGEGGA